MKVKELIKLLLECNQESTVLVLSEESEDWTDFYNCNTVQEVNGNVRVLHI